MLLLDRDPCRQAANKLDMLCLHIWGVPHRHIMDDVESIISCRRLVSYRFRSRFCWRNWSWFWDTHVVGHHVFWSWSWKLFTARYGVMNYKIVLLSLQLADWDAHSTRVVNDSSIPTRFGLWIARKSGGRRIIMSCNRRHQECLRIWRFYTSNLYRLSSCVKERLTAIAMTQITVRLHFRANF